MEVENEIKTQSPKKSTLRPSLNIYAVPEVRLKRRYTVLIISRYLLKCS